MSVVIVQNCYNQAGNRQNNHKFLVCTHKAPLLPQDSERVEARPPAAWVSILYCHGAGHWSEHCRKFDGDKFSGVIAGWS